MDVAVIAALVIAAATIVAAVIGVLRHRGAASSITQVTNVSLARESDAPASVASQSEPGPGPGLLVWPALKAPAAPSRTSPPDPARVMVDPSMGPSAYAGLAGVELDAKFASDLQILAREGDQVRFKPGRGRG